MSNTNDVVDGFLLAIGSAYSLANLEQTLGVVILIIQLIWLITKLAFKIYISIKTKELSTIINDDVFEVVDIIDDIVDTVNSVGGDKDG